MYQAFYKLHNKPFQLTPDPTMLFPSKGHKRAMSYLLYGLEQGEGFVMITGAVGTGKTLLIQKLFEELAHRDIAMAGIASANLDGEDILPAVASAFALPYEGRSKQALLQDVKQHLIALRDRHSHALLVVDEAQTLTSAALEMLRILSNFEVNGHALLQIFLIGQAELQRTIVNNRMEQLRQRIIASHKLEPMGAEECRDYILHRLRAVGWNNDPALAPGIFAGVYLAGRGIPRKINLIMDRLLLHGYLEEQHTLDQAALTVVLDEIREEMADVPQTLEAPTTPARQDPVFGNAPSHREAEFVELDLKQRNNIFLQLMHENIQLRGMLKTKPTSPSVTDETVVVKGAARAFQAKAQMKAISPPLESVVNAMTVDVEDYFQVAAFERCIRREDWSHWPVRVEDNTRRVLDLFARHDVHATFFVLGWVAERFPALVRDISAAGHEVASHGFGHERLTNLTRSEFRDGVIRTKTLLEDLTGISVVGYRAPSYSIGPGTLWAHEELHQAGYRYSSSVVPIHHDLYGMPGAPRFAFFTEPSGLLEIPVTTARRWGRNWPCGGGGYFRLLPYALFKRGLRRVNRQEQSSGVFYFHPWEIDPEQPRVPGVTLKNRVRHYLNLTRTMPRLERLIRDFRFDRMDRVFLADAHVEYPVVALQATELCAD